MQTLLTSGTCKPPFALRAWRSQQAYASHVGADFARRMVAPDAYPYALKWVALESAGLADDTLVLMVDWDVSFTPAAPNLFAHYRAGEIGTVSWPTTLHQGLPLLGTWMLLARVGDLTALFPGYRERIQRYRHYAADEMAFSEIVRERGIATFELPTQGIKHEHGRAKWR